MTDIVKKETADQLKSYIELIEGYESAKQEVSEKLKEVYDGAKAAGFDVKTIRKIVALRKKDKTKLEEEHYLLETYCEAIQLDLFK